MMRTTIDIEDNLLRQAKKIAAQRGVPLAQVVADSLRETFARRQPTAERRKVTLPTVHGTGTLPGVDISNSAELLDYMDQERDAANRR
jgi:hypothetical protein